MNTEESTEMRWRPLREAPKDGTMLVVWHKDNRDDFYRSARYGWNRSDLFYVEGMGGEEGGNDVPEEELDDWHFVVPPSPFGIGKACK